MKAILKKQLVGFVVGAVAVLGSLAIWQPVALAQHGSNNYDTTRSVTVKGTVTQFVWSNPHSQLYFDVTDDKGEVQHWGAEMNQPRMLAVNGFTKDIMKPGDKITITGTPSKSGAFRMFMRQIVLENGKVLKLGKVDQNGNPQNPDE